MLWTDLRADAPRLTIEMRPSPVRWWVGMGVLVLAYASTVAAFVLCVDSRRTTRRRRVLARLLGGLALALVVSDIAGAGATLGDNLGVAGQLSGVPLLLANLAGLLALPLGVVSFGVTVAALRRGPSRPAPAMPA